MYNISSKYKSLFFILDIVAITLSYFTLRIIFGQEFIFFRQSIYGLELVLLTLLSNMFSESYRYIEIRGYLQEIKYSLFYAIQVVIAFGFLVFLHRTHLMNDFYKLTILQLLILAFTSFVWVYVLRTIGRVINGNIKPEKKKVIIITNFNHAEELKQTIEDSTEICAYVHFQGNILEYDGKPVLHNIDMVRQFISENRVDEIYVRASTFSKVKDLLKNMKALGVPTNIDVTEFTTQFLGDVSVRKLKDRFFITSAIKIASLRQIFLKRFMDIVGGLFGSFICVLVGLFIYPKVQKQSPGPMIFKQKRMGKNGKIFNVYKFRSMYVGADEQKKDLMSKNELETTLMFKMTHDPRVFPFGQTLRDWSIDELPQFINVLKGDMSLVGTRPPTLEEYKNYELHHFKRLAMKPGITGLWQVSGRSDIRDFEEVVSLDCQYIQNWSIANDIKILLRTFQVVLKKEGSR